MRKTIVIGLDGATWSNLMPWINEGKLPFLKQLMETGVHATLQTTIPCLTCPAIPSFFTGLSPVKTKTFGFRKPNGKIISANDVKGERFWDVLGKKGFSSIIANLRITYPPKMRNGVMVSSMITPLENSEFVYPHDQKEHFTGFMDKKPSKWNLTKLEGKDREELQRIILDDDLQRFRKYVEYCKDHDFDFELFYFGSTDTIQHRLWNDQQLVLDAYQKIEKVIQDYLADDANVIIFSDHGFGKSPDTAFHIDNWLVEQGLLNYRRTGKMLQACQKIRNKTGSRMFKSLPPGIYNKLYRAYSFFFAPKIKTEIAIDPEKTNTKLIGAKCYLAQKWGIRVIRKNVENYDAFVHELIQKLNALERSGQKIFKAVYRKEDVYPGSARINEVPDIILVPNEKYEVVSGLNAETFEAITPIVEGAHDSFREGIFLASGPDFRKGIEIPQCRIYDIAPTVLFMYGCEIPEMDGQVLRNIISDASKIPVRLPRASSRITDKIRI
ncbi:alkaline phosphatase family protein [Candidatus Woesearchaeota archaeon]|nr:alkaline phosphatase family protein [Candidatus Woesearchaeota archaeon]